MGRVRCISREGALVSNIRKPWTREPKPIWTAHCQLLQPAENRHERSFSSDLFMGKIKMYCARGEEEVREQTELVGLTCVSGKADNRQANRTM